ncbi:CgeB family protein [Paenibacillus agilis]|uniref:Glycosyltransferase n=1 Tax=Paenibacillus agilis TaxID=3020863 RepID=A0A559IHM8_9BACL|nr:glycosyltransferase [Paenibacillus agilis]TVX87182.1 glycosyltransferase [Paenibacillus agilis]
MTGATEKKGIVKQSRPSLLHQVRSASHKGAREGHERGYGEGYFRGRAQALVHALTEHAPQRQLRIIYVSSGKGFPYSPLDEAVVSTLQSMAIDVQVAGPKDSIAVFAVEYRADLVLVLDGMDFPAEQLIELKALAIRTALWITDDPYYTDRMAAVAPYYDYIFTLESTAIEYYQSLGCRQVHHLPFAAFPEHFTPRASPAPFQNDISFIGSAYWNRVRFFEPIMDRLMKHKAHFSGLWWDRLPQYKKYKSSIKLDLWMGPKETAEFYNSSKIVINMHRTHDDTTVNQNSNQILATSPNPRTFEINGCGTLQLTDIRSDLAQFYVPGVELVTYESPADLLEKAVYYLTHEEERREIALRGLARTLKDHSYAKRIQQLLSIIFDRQAE